MKLVRCRDHGFDCDFEAHAHTEEEILKKVADHGQSVHNLDITPDVVEQVRKSIQDVPEDKA